MLKKVKKMAYGGLAGQTDLPGAASGTPQSAFAQPAGQPVPPTANQGLNLGAASNAPVVNVQTQNPSNPNTGGGPMSYPAPPQTQANLPGVGHKKGGAIKAKKMAKGGYVRAADGAAKRGRTKGRTL